MSGVDAKKFVELLIKTTDRTSAPVNLHDRIAEMALAERLAHSLNDALELVEPHLSEIRAITRRHRNSAEREGVSWHIELFGSDEEWIRGAAFVDLSLASEERLSRARRAHVEEVKSEIVGLSPAEFERACTTVLEKLGCQDPHTSSLRNDGGIDFYGQLALKGRLDADLPLGGIDSHVNVWLIGQAKHYPRSAIQTSVIREMVGSVELARTGGAIHSWEGLSLRPFDAVVILVFTTGWFSSGSKALLAQSGMLAMNGDQLATFLCDVGLGFSGQPPVFSRANFRKEVLGQI
jgi:hypothetical protein